jgi:hypothetical protein
LQHRPLRQVIWILLFLLLSGGTPAAADHEALQDPVEIDRIRDLLHRYSLYIDDGRGDEFEELFAKDATFNVLDMRIRGRSAIRIEFVGPPGRLRKHLPFTAVVEIRSLSEARAWSDFIMVRLPDPEQPGLGEVYQMGRYYDRLIKQADGRWRFAERNVFVLGMTNTADFLPLPGRGKH